MQSKTHSGMDFFHNIQILVPIASTERGPAWEMGWFLLRNEQANSERLLLPYRVTIVLIRQTRVTSNTEEMVCLRLCSRSTSHFLKPSWSPCLFYRELHCLPLPPGTFCPGLDRQLHFNQCLSWGYSSGWCSCFTAAIVIKSRPHQKFTERGHLWNIEFNNS